MLKLFLAPIAAGLIAAPASAPAQTVTPAAPATDEGAKLLAIGARGRLLYELDRAAWVATDSLVKKVRDPGAAGLKGYVVEPDGAGFAVTFFGGEPNARVAIYVARVAGGRVTSDSLLPAAERIALTPLQVRLANARSAAASIPARPCTAAPFNAALVPPSSIDAPVEIYLTSPQTEAGIYPFGGHYLMIVGPDGGMVSLRKFTNSCLNMPIPRGSKRRGQPAAAVVSHLLDPTPTEIHVFLSIAIGKPVYVITSNPERIWVVQGEKIALAAAGDAMARAIRARQ